MRTDPVPDLRRTPNAARESSGNFADRRGADRPRRRAPRTMTGELPGSWLLRRLPGRGGTAFPSRPLRPLSLPRADTPAPELQVAREPGLPDCQYHNALPGPPVIPAQDRQQFPPSLKTWVAPMRLDPRTAGIAMKSSRGTGLLNVSGNCCRITTLCGRIRLPSTRGIVHHPWTADSPTAEPVRRISGSEAAHAPSEQPTRSPFMAGRWSPRRSSEW